MCYNRDMKGTLIIILCVLSVILSAFVIISSIKDKEPSYKVECEEVGPLIIRCANEVEVCYLTGMGSSCFKK